MPTKTVNKGLPPSSNLPITLVAALPGPILRSTLRMTHDPPLDVMSQRLKAFFSGQREKQALRAFQTLW